MTLQQHHSGAEKPSTFAVNYAGLPQQEMTGSAALQNRQFDAASSTQGMQHAGPQLHCQLESMCAETCPGQPCINLAFHFIDAKRRSLFFSFLCAETSIAEVSV